MKINDFYREIYTELLNYLSSKEQFDDARTLIHTLQNHSFEAYPENTAKKQAPRSWHPQVEIATDIQHCLVDSITCRIISAVPGIDRSRDKTVDDEHLYRKLQPVMHSGVTPEQLTTFLNNTVRDKLAFMAEGVKRGIQQGAA